MQVRVPKSGQEAHSRRGDKIYVTGIIQYVRIPRDHTI